MKQVTLSTGVVLNCKAVSAMTLAEVSRSIKKPRVPRWHNPENDRDEENPNHPDYLDAVEEYDAKISDTYTRAVFMLGTDIVSAPKELPGIESNAWVDELGLIGLTFDAGNKSIRRVEWLKHVAAPTTDDINLIMNAVGTLSGVSQEKVEQAEDSFRVDAGRDADK